MERSLPHTVSVMGPADLKDRFSIPRRASSPNGVPPHPASLGPNTGGVTAGESYSIIYLFFILVQFFIRGKDCYSLRSVCMPNMGNASSHPRLPLVIPAAQIHGVVRGGGGGGVIST